MPEAVDEQSSIPTTTNPLPLPNPAKFSFLAIFNGPAQTWDVLLASYLREFSATDDVCPSTAHLSIPANPTAIHPLRFGIDQTCRDSRSWRWWPHFTSLNRFRRRTCRASLQTADCLVRAESCGEGQGRPHHEAMMMGLPVIATNWSGNTGIHERSSFLIGLRTGRNRARSDELPTLSKVIAGQIRLETDLRAALRRVQQSDEAPRGRRGLSTHGSRCWRNSVVVKLDLLVARLAEIERKWAEHASARRLQRDAWNWIPAPATDAVAIQLGGRISDLACEQPRTAAALAATGRLLSRINNNAGKNTNCPELRISPPATFPQTQSRAQITIAPCVTLVGNVVLGAWVLMQ